MSNSRWNVNEKKESEHTGAYDNSHGVESSQKTSTIFVFSLL
jgi:hypothetical protein